MENLLMSLCLNDLLDMLAIVKFIEIPLTQYKNTLHFLTSPNTYLMFIIACSTVANISYSKCHLSFQQKWIFLYVWFWL